MQVVSSLEGHERDVHSVAYSVDGRIIASNSNDEARVLIWDAKTGKELKDCILTEPCFNSTLSFCPPEGGLLAIHNPSEGLEFRQKDSWQVAKRIPSFCNRFFFSQDGSLLGTTGLLDGVISLFEVWKLMEDTAPRQIEEVE
ncbi:hypothetical protein QBC44DRAFT_309233 [Cladorrhinum sp. PSN332]|nr:hypothetical protein QBC44DRAFT_309233 [Cladorrhinum sp. PSN332]